MFDLAQIDAGKVAHQIMLEKLYSKNQLIPRIKQEILNEKLMMEYIESLDLAPKFCVDLLVQMCLHKRTTLPIMVGILRHHFDTLQECCDAIYKAIEYDLVDWNQFEQLVLKFDISKDVQEELDKFQFPLPMVVEPRGVKTNRDSGYLEAGFSSLILKNNHHDEDICLDHINRVNQIKFCVNHDTATMVKNSWRNLDKPKQGESKQDFQKRVKAFNKYDAMAHEVISLLVQEGNEFYLTHAYDKRGRIYSRGYFINYQGNPWSKAIIELADKEIVP